MSLLGSCDVVTNFGTTEHVGVLPSVFIGDGPTADFFVKDGSLQKQRKILLASMASMLHAVPALIIAVDMTTSTLFEHVHEKS